MRIILTVPDKILRTLSTFETSRTKQEPTCQETIIKALEGNDYDEHYHFPPGSVKVEFID